MRGYLALAGIVATAIATPAHSLDVERYGAIRLGYSQSDLSSTSIPEFIPLWAGNTPKTKTLGTSPDETFTGSITLGLFAPAHRIRGEIELSHTVDADFREAYQSGPGGGLGLMWNRQVEVSYSTTLLMLNIVQDFPLTESLSVFAGGGAGAAMTMIEGRGVTRALLAPAIRWSAKERKVTPALALLGGASWKINERYTAEIRYRYVDAGNFSAFSDVSTSAGVIPRATHYEGHLTLQSVTIGVRYSF